MRYLILTYYRKADGKIDETMAVSRNLKPRDLQTANVILDFRTLSVIKCSMQGAVVPRDWDRIVSYYHQHYANIIERLLKENGYEIVVGNRQFKDGYKLQNKRKFHSLGNSVFTAAVNFLYKQNLQDVLSGYRALTSNFVKNYPIVVTGFDIEMDMTIHALDQIGRAHV